MDKITELLIVKALDNLVVRQQYTAQNIANANTPAYRTIVVNFEETLRTAALTGDIRNIEAVRPNVAFKGAEQSDQGVRLDLELATASQTAMRYSALIEILGRQMALNRAVLAASGR